MANTGTNCTYLCNQDAPVERQPLSAGPPTESWEGKAIYVRSSCCCPQQVVRLSKCLFQDKNSTWILLARPLFSLMPGSVCLLHSPLFLFDMGSNNSEMEDSSPGCSLTVPCLLWCFGTISVRHYQAVQVYRSTSQLSWTIHLHEEARDSNKKQSCRRASVHTAKMHTFTWASQKKHHRQDWARPLCHRMPPPLQMIAMGPWLKTPGRILPLSRT